MSDDRHEAQPPRTPDDDSTGERREAANADQGHALSPAVPVRNDERDADAQPDQSDGSNSSDLSSKPDQSNQSNQSNQSDRSDQSARTMEDSTLAYDAARPVPTADPPRLATEAETAGRSGEGSRGGDSPGADANGADASGADSRSDDSRIDESPVDDRTEIAASHDATRAQPVQPVVTEHPVTAPASQDTPSRYSPPANPPAAQEVAPAPAPTTVQPGAPAPTPIYVQAPIPPRKKGNRGVGVLIAFVATIVFALLYALGAAALASITNPDAFGEPLARYLTTPVYWIPVLIFFAAFALLIVIANRANWWAYVLGGFPVAVIVYAAYIGARLIQQDIMQLTPAEAALVVQRVSTFPDGILAAVLAREIVIWAGAAISARGRRVKSRNADARAEYDRKLAETPGA